MHTILQVYKPIIFYWIISSSRHVAGLQNLCLEFANCECHKDATAISISCINVKNITIVSDIQKQLNFPALRYVRVSGFMKYLPERWVFNNRSLEIVIFNSPFESLHDEALAGLTSVQNLNIETSKFKTIPKALAKLRNLIALHLKSGELQVIRNELQDLTSLRYLSLDNNNIEEISSDAFINNTVLEVVSFTGNRITSFEPGTFRFCGSINTFFASRNRLQSMTGVTISHSLRTLVLEGNGLLSLEGLFYRYRIIVKINVARNKQLKPLSDSVFTGGLRFLRELILHSCELKALPPNLIQPLPGLRYIDLKHNRLQTIPEAFFDNLRELRVVDLIGNILYSLGDFTGAVQLRTIFLRENKLHSLNRIKFAASLKHIELQRNKLGTIAEGDFKDCASLEDLNLGYSQISSIHTNAFASLTYLKSLILDRNRITSLNGSLKHLQNLQSLSLKHNRLKAVDKMDFYQLQRLESLNLEHNKLISVNGAFVRLTSLKYLTLRRNKLSVLPRNAFPNEMALRRLRVSTNKWICDCRLTWIREKLVSGDIILQREHLLCSKPDRFHMRKLTDLTTEELTQWPDDCPDMCICTCVPQNETLYVHVDCSGKGLEKIPSNFPSATGWLSLRHNLLSNQLNFKFDVMKNLWHLDLESNFIKELDFRLPDNLTVLKVAGNNLTRFYSQPPESVSLWTISNNPWICDCETKKFRKWILSNRDNVPDANFTRCSPDNVIRSLSSRAIIHLFDSDLCPTFISIYVTVAVSILLILLLGTTSRLLYSRYHYHAKVWLYSRGFKWLKKAQDGDARKKYDAFISSSDQDLHLVKNFLMPELEEREPYYVLFEPRRDMMGGEMFEYKKEMEEVMNSRRVIILLSKDYIENEFLMRIFKLAFVSSLEEKLYRIILIAVGDLPPLSSLDQSLKAAVESTRCLRFGQRLFWEMLKFAMPDKTGDQNVDIVEEDDECLLLTNVNE